jgi:hypothetical protein
MVKVRIINIVLHVAREFLVMGSSRAELILHPSISHQIGESRNVTA